MNMWIETFFYKLSCNIRFQHIFPMSLNAVQVDDIFFSFDDSFR